MAYFIIKAGYYIYSAYKPDSNPLIVLYGRKRKILEFVTFGLEKGFRPSINPNHIGKGGGGNIVPWETKISEKFLFSGNNYTALIKKYLWLILP